MKHLINLIMIPVTILYLLGVFVIMEEEMSNVELFALVFVIPLFSIVILIVFLCMVVAPFCHRWECRRVLKMDVDELSKKCPDFKLPENDDKEYIALAGVTFWGGQEGHPRESSEPIHGLLPAYIEARRLGLLVETKEIFRNPKMTMYEPDDSGWGGDDYPDSLGVYWKLETVEAS